MAAIDTQHPMTVDPSEIKKIARQVIAQLRASASSFDPASQPTQTKQTARVIEEKVISVHLIDELPETTSQLFVRSDAVITPAAIDEVKRRQIEINRTADDNSKSSVEKITGRIIDARQPKRAVAVAAQLKSRGLERLQHQIILSDKPAQDLHQLISEQGEVAAVAGSLEEISRFSKELAVTTWVLDMKRLNLTAAVNVAARIARMEKSGK
jgi:hypothetical protein